MGNYIKKYNPPFNNSVPVANIDVSNLADWTNVMDFDLDEGKGVYQVWFNLGGAYSHAGAFDNHWIEVRIYDDVADAVVAGTNRYLIPIENLAPNGDLFYRNCSINFTIRTTQDTTLRLQAISHSITTGAVIDKDHTNFGFVKIA